MTDTVAVMEPLGTCDVDGSSRAVIRVKLPGSGSLEFCLHHWREREVRMLELLFAEITVDERAALK